MSVNIEFKAHISDPDLVKRYCIALGAHLTRDDRQIDTYFSLTSGYLKLRANGEAAAQLIHYDRLATPTARESNFSIVDVSPVWRPLQAVLSTALGVRAEVVKHRSRFELPTALINVDTVEGLGHFAEVEVDVQRTGSVEAANAFALELRQKLQIRIEDFVSWSYSELLTMYRVASEWRARLASAERPGTLFLIDGPSGSGKTTLTQSLIASSGELAFVPRYSTRARRSAGTEDEYRFVTMDEFRQIAQSGGFLEFRDFEFGMSYGLAWEDIMAPLLAGRNAVALVNLGNIHHIRRVFPEAVKILITSPMSTLQHRLVQRGYNNAEQIEERLQNARLVNSYRSAYDYVIDNDDGALQASVEKLVRIVDEHTN